MWMRVWTRCCCVAAFVVAVRAWGRGARDAVGRGSICGGVSLAAAVAPFVTAGAACGGVNGVGGAGGGGGGAGVVADDAPAGIGAPAAAWGRAWVWGPAQGGGGCWLGAGGLKGPVAIQRPGGPTWSAAVCGGGMRLQSPTFGVGCAKLLQFARVRGSASAQGNSSPGLRSGAGRNGPRLTWAVCGRRLKVTGWARCAVGRRASCVWVARCGGR